MRSFHIISNPYLRRLSFEFRKDTTREWIPIDLDHNPNSLLISESYTCGTIEELGEKVLNEILAEYGSDNEVFHFVFSGIDEEYSLLSSVFPQNPHLKLLRSAQMPAETSVVTKELDECLSCLEKASLDNSTLTAVQEHRSFLSSNIGYYELGKTFFFIQAVVDDLSSKENESMKRANQVVSVISSINESKPNHFKIKLNDSVNITIEMIRLNCSEMCKKIIQSKIMRYSTLDIKKMEKETSNDELLHNWSSVAIHSDKRGQKALLRSLEVENKKKIQKKIVNQLELYLVNEQFNISREFSQMIMNYYMERVMLIKHAAIDCILKYGNPVLQDRMLSAAAGINHLSLVGKVNDSCSNFDISELYLVDPDNLSNRYNHLVQNKYNDYIDEQCKQSEVLLKNDVASVIELIANIDLESDINFGSQIRSYNDYRSEYMKYECILKQMTPLMKRVSDLIGL